MNQKNYKEIAKVMKHSVSNIHTHKIAIAHNFVLASDLADYFEREDKEQFKEVMERNNFTQEDAEYKFNKQQFLKDCGCEVLK